MADVFIEHMVTQRSNPTIMGKKAGLFLAAFVVALLPVLLSGVLPVISLLPLTALGAGWGFVVLNRRLNLEFEYILTNGEIDIDKIMGKTSRKRMLTVDCHQFDILAPMTEEYRREYQSNTIRNVIDVSSYPDAPGRWFAVFAAKDGVRTLLIFEPSEKMLGAMRLFTQSKMKG